MRVAVFGAFWGMTAFSALSLGACSSRDLPSGNTNTAGLSGAGTAGNSAELADGGTSNAAGSGGNAGSSGSFNIPEDAQRIMDGVRIQTLKEVPNQREAFAELDFSGGPFAKATLFVTLDTSCYPFEKWRTNPPPVGQNWPADCDAFDRNFEISLDNPATPEAGPPGIELARAITPFGGPLQMALDVTDLANGLPGKHQLRVWIAVYADKAGKVTGTDASWKVSAAIKLEPGVAPRKVLAVTPLAYAGQKLKDGPALNFEVPAGTTRGRIEYRSTGHGQGALSSGCVGPAEEFCERTHSLRVDGAVVDEFEPWRDDCETLCTLSKSEVISQEFCAENPCGAIASVRAPRANWCPGSVSAPRIVENPALAVAGAHTFAWNISELITGGEWRISATYFAYGD
jgi:hypothetical protein